MSGGEISEKDEDPCKEEPKIKNCPHEFCHRDEIESDRPIGLPFAPGRLKYIPGQEPDPYNFKMRKILKKKKCMKDKKKEIAEIINACPPILENLLIDDPQIEDEMQYLFNLVLEVGDQDVGEYLTTFRENMAKAKEEAEKIEAESVKEASVAVEEEEETAEEVPAESEGEEPPPE